MDVFPKKYNFFSNKIIILATLFFISTIVFPTISKAEIVKYPDTDYFDPINSKTGKSYPIVFEFDQPIQFPAGTTYNVIVEDVSTTGDNGTTATTDVLPASGSGYGTFPAIELKHVEDGSELEISLDIKGNRLLIYPNPDSPLWGENKEYELSITDRIVENTDGSDALDPGTLSNPYIIGTDSLSFEKLMTGSKKINSIIKEYTPRQINVLSPQRYIDVIDIIHRRQEDIQGSSTESVTNIDVTIKHSSSAIKRIEVTPKQDGTNLQRKKVIDHLDLVPKTGSHVYDFGFTRLPDTTGFDFEIELYDINNKLLDKRIVKVPYEKSTTTTIKQKDRYKDAGKTYTLYELLKNPKNLQKLLDENRMDEITVQVVQE